MNTKEMFNKIASTYDRNTGLISFGIENIWRNYFIKRIVTHTENINSYLDVASATGEMIKHLHFKHNVALEPSSEMNKIAKEKLKGLDVTYIEEGAETFSCEEKFDLVTVFMGVRNFENIEEGLKNIDKHIKEGGIIAIAELTTPKRKSPLFYLSNFYMTHIVPLLGGLLSGNFKAYRFFPKSIKKMSDDDILCHLDKYTILEQKRLFPPMASLIIAKKNG